MLDGTRQYVTQDEVSQLQNKRTTTDTLLHICTPTRSSDQITSRCCTFWDQRCWSPYAWRILQRWKLLWYDTSSLSQLFRSCEGVKESSSKFLDIEKKQKCAWIHIDYPLPLNVIMYRDVAFRLLLDPSFPPNSEERSSSGNLFNAMQLRQVHNEGNLPTA